MDVLLATRVNNRIGWYENLDGKGTFGEERVLFETFGTFWVATVTAADLDGDGDQDVLWTADNRVAWNENLDGKGRFGEHKIVESRSLARPANTELTDLDGDDDQDIVVAWSDKIIWYANLDGDGMFERSSELNVETGGTFDVGDLDGDGDKDVIAVSRTELDRKLVWFENTNGLGDFSEERLFAEDSGGVTLADIDNDGDNDVVVSTLDSVMLYENTNGLGEFGTPQVTSTERFNGNLAVADLDGDLDLEIVLAQETPNKISLA